MPVFVGMWLLVVEDDDIDEDISFGIVWKWLSFQSLYADLPYGAFTMNR